MFFMTYTHIKSIEHLFCLPNEQTQMNNVYLTTLFLQGSILRLIPRTYAIILNKIPHKELYSWYRTNTKGSKYLIQALLGQSKIEILTQPLSMVYRNIDHFHVLQSKLLCNSYVLTHRIISISLARYKYPDVFEYFLGCASCISGCREK